MSGGSLEDAPQVRDFASPNSELSWAEGSPSNTFLETTEKQRNHPQLGQGFGGKGDGKMLQLKPTTDTLENPGGKAGDTEHCEFPLTPGTAHMLRKEPRRP